MGNGVVFLWGSFVIAGLCLTKILFSYTSISFPLDAGDPRAFLTTLNSEMEFFTLYSRWNFPFLLLSILLAYFRNDFSGFIPNIAAMTQPLFLVLNSEMHLLLLHSLCLCIFPSKLLIWFPCFPPGSSFSLHGSPIDLRIFRIVTIFYKWAAAEEFSTGDRTRVECF